MKRKYVKPIMESEAFVANEYVAACYFVDCTHYGCIDPQLIKGVDSEMAALTKFTQTYGGSVAEEAVNETYICTGTLNVNGQTYTGATDSHSDDEWPLGIDWIRRLILYYLGIADLQEHHDLTVLQTTISNNNGHPNASN